MKTFLVVVLGVLVAALLGTAPGGTRETGPPNTLVQSAELGAAILVNFDSVEVAGERREITALGQEAPASTFDRSPNYGPSIDLTLAYRANSAPRTARGEVRPDSGAGPS